MSSTYSIREFGRMIRDEARMGAYVGALQRAVKPGDTVLDIGAGTGIFSFLAVQAGAARVYAIESLDVIEIARQCAAKVPGAERITWIQGLSTDTELPERVDVVIGDLHGNLPFYAGNIRSLIDARQRHLKPGGRMIPLRDQLWAVPAQARDEAYELERPWRQNSYGLDLSDSRPYIANQVSRTRSSSIPLSSLLSQPARWGVIDYAVTEATGLEGTMAFTISRDADLHGFHVWFDTETDDVHVISNAPGLPDKVFGSAFFPTEETVPVVEGDQVTLALSAREFMGSYSFRWDTRVCDAAGRRKANFRQSTFKAQVLSKERLEAAAAGDRARLNQEGAVLRYVLPLLDAGRPAEAIAEGLVQRFPARYPDTSSARDHVERLARDYT